ncbi:MAG: peptidoglycan-binding protein [Desulfobacteraceae bacterium]|nr:peptidoglycan-binding protein [Desulfobacteraceae bacterium]
MYKREIEVDIKSEQTLDLLITARKLKATEEAIRGKAYPIKSIKDYPTLKLGCVDRGAMPPSKDDYTRKYHRSGMKQGLLQDPNGNLRELTEMDNTPVKDVQTVLRTAGFYRYGEIDGIYGYRTLSAVRLFQEYVRNLENKTDIGVPDGIAGKKTHSHLQRWIDNNLAAHWNIFNPNSPTDEYKKWLQSLEKIKEHYKKNTDQPDIKLLNRFSGVTDTIKINDWDFDKDKIHILGIRREENVSEKRKANIPQGRPVDDVFVLLINGMTFTFWGSTDPSQKQAMPLYHTEGEKKGELKRAGTWKEPFILRGQHKYRLWWHHSKYRAYHPERHGVLVVRDVSGDDALTLADYADDRDAQANKSINIHWSGIGTSNYSAGCQVVAGKSYITYTDRKVDCSKYTARWTSELGSDKTRGAYNVLIDLITVFSKKLRMQGGDILYYTLIYDDDLDLIPETGKDLAKDTLERLKSDKQEEPAANATISIATA